MNDRELQLIIKAEVAQAEANVKKFVGELLKAKTGTSDLQKELDNARARFDLLGDRSAFLSTKQAALSKEMDRLIQEGVKPQEAELRKLAEEYQTTSKELDEAKEKTMGFGDVVKKAMELESLKEGTKKIGEFAVDSVQAFANAETASMRLDNALKINGLEGSKEALNELAESTKNLTGVDDDLVKQKEAELIASGKSIEMTENLIKAATDYASVSGQDLPSAIDELTGSLSGQAREMGRTLPEIKDMTAEQLKAGGAVDLLLSKYGAYTDLMAGSTTVELKRLAAAQEDVSKSMGQAFMPIVLEATDALEGMAKWVIGLPDWMKSGLVVVLTTLAGLMVGLTARIVVQTAAQWGLFGAQMATAAAAGALNPLIWAGVAAAIAATTAVVALANAHSKKAAETVKAAEADNQAADAARDRLAAMKDAAKQMDDYKDSIDSLTLAQARAEKARLVTERGSFNGAIVTPQLTAKLDLNSQEQAQIDDLIKKLQKEADKASREAAVKVQDDALRSFESIIEGSKTEVEKLQDQIKSLGSVSFSRPENQAKQVLAIDELKKKLAEAQIQAALQRQADEAKYTATRLDDIEAERAQELHTLALKFGSDQNYAALMAEVNKKYNDQVLAARAEEETKTLADEAKRTGDRLLALEAEYRKDLILATGNAEEKARIEKKFNDDVANEKLTRAIEDAKKEAEARKQAFEDQKKLAEKNSDLGGIVSSAAQTAAAGTEVGQLAGLGGAAAVNPMALVAEEAAKFVMSIKSVQEALSPFSTMFEAGRKLLEPLIDEVFKPMGDLFREIGSELGNVLAPFLTILATVVSVVVGVMKVTLVPVLQVLGAAFGWLNDTIIVPFGNAIIWVINGIIGAINFALGWAGVHLQTLETLKTTKEIANIQAQIAEKEGIVNDQLSQLTADFDKQRAKLNDAYDLNVTSLKRLLEVGAIDSAEYSSRIESLNASHQTDIDNLTSEEKKQSGYLQEILKQLQSGNNVAVPSFDVGTTSVPRDMLAMIHKGETIIPADFSAGLRRGDLALGNTGKMSGTTTVISITVEGSIHSEDGLADTLARKISRRVGRGQLEIA
jgi:hypothetical protein